MGALVGALYASGHTPAEMRTVALSDAFTKVFALQTPYVDVSFRRRQDRRQVPATVTFGLKHGLGLRNALFIDRDVDAFLTSNMLDYNFEELDFNQTPIPFRCVATDLNTLQSITFSSGSLPQAVRASISIPGVFPPVQGRNGHYLIDGGILDNLPTDVLKQELHADVIIAVRLNDADISAADTSSIVGVLNRAFAAGIERNVDQSAKLADVSINVPVGNFSGADYSKAAELIQAGYNAAQQNRSALLPYALDEQGWSTYLAARNRRRRSQPGLLRLVHVEGGSPAAAISSPSMISRSHRPECSTHSSPSSPTEESLQPTPPSRPPLPPQRFPQPPPGTQAPKLPAPASQTRALWCASATIQLGHLTC
jgi:NTE family protein